MEHLPDRAAGTRRSPIVRAMAVERRPAQAALIAWALIALCGVCLLAGLIVLARSLAVPVPQAVWGVRGQAAIIVSAAVFVGGLLALKRPENRVSWLILASGAAGAIQFVGEEYAIAALGAPMPGASIAAWLSAVMWIPQGAFLIEVALLFPNGTLLSPRWRTAALGVALGSAATFLFFAVRPGQLQVLPYDNPLGLAASRDAFVVATPFVSAVFGLGGMLAVISGVLRYRARHGEVRQQLKWLLVVGSFAAIAELLALVVPDAKPLELLAAVGIAAFLLSIAIAVLKYGLYEIDTILERSAVYGILTAFLAGLFVALQEVLKRVFVATTGENSDLAVVLSLFVIATAFAPVRSRLQAVVDRIFKPAPTVAAPTAGTNEFEVALRALARLHADGILSDAEYEAKKRELLARL